MRLYYQLKAIDPIIISINNSTATIHGSLDYIPGSAILGAFAAELYPDFTEQQSWDAFHNGNTRFSPAYPVADQQLCLPVPASWHFEKGQNAIENHRYNNSAIINHACQTFDRSNEENEIKQFKQCREGYVNANGLSAQVSQTEITKTAINSQTGTAKESQLYSYSSINPGQQFAGWIDSNDEQLLEEFRQIFKSTLRIGRSRNTEFGRVFVRLIDSVKSEVKFKENEKQLVLWCLSDCEFFSSAGLPTFTPELQSIHPDLSGTLNRRFSFIRTTRISRFNQKRQGLDGEQNLVSKGSVMVFDLDKKPDSDILQLIQDQGVGRNRQQGLGWVMINPQWALTEKMTEAELFPALSIIDKPTETQLEITDTAFLLWLKSKVNGEQNNESRHKRANELLGKIVQAYENARNYSHIYPSREAGPSSNQWRRIADKVRNSNSENWKNNVFDGNAAICKASNDEQGWGIEWSSEGNQIITFADFAKNILKDTDLATMRLLLEKLNAYDLSTSKGLRSIKTNIKISSNEQEESI